ncbi:MAG: sensor histidine kinase, partial [Anaerolineae bacterium]|nr:sensor histidine kinase [Anaerolineae bacterium]
HIFLQSYRYRYCYSPKQRQQTKWLIFGYAIALTISITLAIFISPPYGRLLEGVTTAFGFYFPIAAGMTIAILRYNLWDIDVIINRTLVYSVLTALLVAIYALIVSLLSLLIQDEGSFAVSLVGAGIIAVIFQPLRAFIQRAINRWMFGQRDEPLAVMIEFGKSLEMIASPEAALSYLAETTARSLKLPYVAIENEATNLVAVSGEKITQCEQFPLIYQAENIGTLLVSSRSPGEVLSAGDRLLLENVARQVSNIVHAARLTQDLQQSRQEILTTREEERRRLRRDLHDGLGPALATLTLQAEAAREWLATKPEKSDALLQEIILGSQSTLADIRRIVYALRPPALDDLGLVPAIREQATRYTKNDLSITVEAPEQLPPIPAAVEVATYRIVQEALTNVARHSKARTCTVCLRINGKMDIEVIDDGVGIPSQKRAGVGLNSIHERAAELGGSCVIQSKPGQGTQILVSLPGA